ncbi:uncharacterized protein SPPG_07746 [Spizellomyces punctatus DAOM BR117]|uniref:MARVEL domain-containing protein n=1 Tax=Spizellomyces punctatus (strain DAOM BR117) TaxID=645134 RepID=A0A0L0H7P1_SPIPD|nr:uncharacterized protein SPPG_07746 [Spizellomyces punctatus DAOM BR117]KNC96921.1 hypothetical protein SPPG_07746 [Spizellomyces punctatus DAOM BR117]|eukprot:XP_016604961.1 hypothetical protein SPPG_07746 [Spizellomyces punctatus DAOM BR117]
MAKSLGERLTTLKTISVNKFNSLRPPPTVGSFDRHFHIDKQARFATRFFEVLVGIASWYFIGKLKDPLIGDHDLWPTVRYTWFCAVFSPIVSVALVGQHFISCLSKAWSSIKVLILEIIVDVFITFAWLVCLITLGSKMSGDCPPNSSDECNMFNWVLAWGSFSVLFWFASVVWDVKSLLKGVWGWGGERLNDTEMDAEIRRMSRNAGSGRRWR